MKNDFFAYLRKLLKDSKLKRSKARISEILDRLQKYDDTLLLKTLLDRIPLQCELAALEGYTGLEVMPLFNGTHFENPTPSEHVLDSDIIADWLIGTGKRVYTALAKAGYAPQLVMFHEQDKGIKRISKSHWAIVINW